VFRIKQPLSSSGMKKEEGGEYHLVAQGEKGRRESFPYRLRGVFISSYTEDGGKGGFLFSSLKRGGRERKPVLLDKHSSRAFPLGGGREADGEIVRQEGGKGGGEADLFLHNEWSRKGSYHLREGGDCPSSQKRKGGGEGIPGIVFWGTQDGQRTHYRREKKGKKLSVLPIMKWRRRVGHFLIKEEKTISASAKIRRKRKTTLIL